MDQRVGEIRIGEIRKIAESRFLGLSVPGVLPTVKNEAYRYTSLSSVILDRKARTLTEATPIHASLLRNPEELALAVVQAASSRAEIDSEASPSSALIMSLEEISERHPDVFAEIHQYLSPGPGMDSDVFANLAMARAPQTLVVVVRPGVKLSLPIRSLQFFNQELDAFFHHTLVVAQEGSEFSFVDEMTGNGALNGKRPLTSGLLRIHAEKGARIKASQIQNFGPSVEAFLRTEITLDQDANVEFTPFFSGGIKVQSRLIARPLAPGARFTLRGAARGDGMQHFDFWNEIRHTTPHTQSQTQYWSVMADEARSVFNGLISISPEATQTQASQKNHNMLLSEKAVIDTLPKLEISTDDVQCSHGATISPVNEDQLFYMQSRGISAQESELMIINGFTDPVLDLLPGESLRRRISQVLSSKHRRRGA